MSALGVYVVPAGTLLRKERRYDKDTHQWVQLPDVIAQTDIRVEVTIDLVRARQLAAKAARSKRGRAVVGPLVAKVLR